jgi:DNA-binding transcriptional LysR family regulator
LKQLKEGELDAVFVSRTSGLTGVRERLAFCDELVVVAPATSAADVKPWQTDGPPLKVLVQRLGCSYTERLLAFLAERSNRSYRLLELGTLEGILGFVETGMGIAAMPRAFVRAAAAKRRLQLYELPKKVRELRTYLVIPAGTESSFATEAFFNWTKAN